MYKSFIRPVLFRFNAESVHHFAFSSIRLMHKIPLVPTLLRKIYQKNTPNLGREVFGLHFPNPVGLAAGFDKNAQLIDELGSFGFGFIEIGTVTPRPQEGNPKPRLFRLKADQALINRMGFNNEGLETVIKNLKKRKSKILVGGNIGKNKITPNEEATQDYLKSFDALFEYVDYFVVNVSSPNTPNLRALQDKAPLTELLQSLQNHNQQKLKPKPILLKIAPDLSNTQLDEIIEVVQSTKIAGVIATNTTLRRDKLQTPSSTLTAIGAGGLSGKPLKDSSTEVIRYLHQQSGGTLPIIGVGGIHSPKDALEKLQAGASLVQLYTGFVYEGPGIVRKINQFLEKSLGSK